jgi:hypothetical protein
MPEKTVQQHGLDTLAATVANNFRMMVDKYGAAETPRIFAFAVVMTAGRWASNNIARDRAIEWFTRAYDGDGFTFGGGEDVD